MDEPSCSHSTPKQSSANVNTRTQEKNPDEKATSSSSEDEVLKMDEAQKAALQALKIDEHLEDRLKKHGVNRRNVKTIIHELLNDENVKNILKASMEGDSVPQGLPEAKNLRSKLKKVPEKKVAPSFTELEFPDEEEEEDEEYNPELEENTLDTEDCMSQDTLTSHADLDSSLEEIEKVKDTITVTGDSGLMMTPSNSFLSDLNQIDSELMAIDENVRQSMLNDDEIIAQRTRSKHSLMDIALVEIETAFKPPDVTEDMYVPSGDTDWHKWLAELMMDEGIVNKANVTEEDDKEFDPDYNFVGSEVDDVVEPEDLRDDPATRISKKEVQELLELLEVPAIDYKGQCLAPTPTTPPKETPRSSNKQVTFMDENESQARALSDAGTSVKQHLQILKHQKTQSQTKLNPQNQNPNFIQQPSMVNFNISTADIQMAQPSSLTQTVPQISTDQVYQHQQVVGLNKQALGEQSTPHATLVTQPMPAEVVNQNLGVHLTPQATIVQVPQQQIAVELQQQTMGVHSTPQPMVLQVMPQPANVQVMQTQMQTNNAFNFTAKQKFELDLQIRQHVQLLSQVNLLCRNAESFSSIVHDTHALLKELQQLGEYNRKAMNIYKSSFDVCGLNEALNIAKQEIDKSEPVTRLTKYERQKGLLPLPRNIATVIASSGVFQFSQLLPTSAATYDLSRLTFITPEDNLLVLGLAQMEGHQVPWHILIHQYMMPTKQPEQIKLRVSNANSGHYRPDHPIRLFRRGGKLPFVPPLILPDAGPGTNTPCMIYLDKCKAPDWLVFLQNEHQSIQNNALPLNQSGSIVTVPSTPSTPNPGKVSTTSLSQTTLPPSVGIVPVSIAISPQVVQLTPTSNAAMKRSPLLTKTPSAKLATNLKKRFSPKRESERKNSGRASKQPRLNPDAKKKEQSRPKLSSSASNQTPKTVTTTNTTTVGATTHTSSTATQVFTVNITSAKAKQLSENKGKEPQQTNENPSVVLVDKTVQNSAEVSLESEATTSKMDTNNTNPDPDEIHDADDEGMTEDDEFDDMEDTEEDEAPAKSSGGKEDLHSDEDTLTEEDMAEEERCEEKKTKKVDDKDSRWRENRRVRWKNRSFKKSKKLGGRLHRLHPGLAGKKARIADEDNLSRNLRKSAENIRLLEEDTIVQLDPSRVEKEMLFAQGYLKKMEEALKDHPDVLVKILEILCQFDTDSSQSPSSLFLRLSEILHPWPTLLKGFAPFLLPEQAHACGLLPEQQVYARARKFLRQLEIRFQDNPPHLNRILNAFHAVAEGSIHTEQEMKRVIMSLLKSDPYLQEQFLMFFDDERPPESRLHGDYEEVIWSDDLLKDAGNPVEHVYIPSAEGQESLEEAHVDEAPKSPSSHRTRVKQTDVNFNTEKENLDPQQNETIVDVAPAATQNDRAWEEAARSEVESEEDVEELDRIEHPAPALCLPSDIGVISEDALSCSPFKRHTTAVSPKSTHQQVTIDRPKTPTNTLEHHETISLPDGGTRESQSSSLGSNLPTTPTGSPRKDVPLSQTKEKSNEEQPWTREDDAILLSVCKELGPCREAFKKASELLKRDDTESRFGHLMSLLAGDDLTDDTDTASQDESDESDSADS
uniref:GON-4-like protein n=1 Tax=Phallusia mammillata TaxID=59560 RepID=A0A6F9DEL8_9ASCI|nr:GON-4-like protein [Phallusia mammillata]